MSEQRSSMKAQAEGAPGAAGQAVRPRAGRQAGQQAGDGGCRPGMLGQHSNGFTPEVARALPGSSRTAHSFGALLLVGWPSCWPASLWLVHTSWQTSQQDKGSVSSAGQRQSTCQQECGSVYQCGRAQQCACVCTCSAG